MRLVTYRHQNGPRPAAVRDRGGDRRLIDLGHLAPSLVEIIASPSLMKAAQRTVDDSTPVLSDLPKFNSVTLLSPVRPGKILCLGYNYRGHVPAGQHPEQADPDHPDVFVKTPNVLTSPGEPVYIPAASTHVDYEGEIALVIGARAHAVSEKVALSHVAGFTLFNDVTDRDWQARQSQWALGKCFDGFGPLGPELVTTDEIADPKDLLMEVERNGVLTVSQNTSTMIFSMAYIVHYLSQVLTLEPGDIISTGSPQKVPAALAAHLPLTDGDTVTVRVEGIGELTNTFRRAHH